MKSDLIFEHYSVASATTAVETALSALFEVDRSFKRYLIGYINHGANLQYIKWTNPDGWKNQEFYTYPDDLGTAGGRIRMLPVAIPVQAEQAISPLGLQNSGGGEQINVTAVFSRVIPSGMRAALLVGYRLAVTAGDESVLYGAQQTLPLLGEEKTVAKFTLKQLGAHGSAAVVLLATIKSPELDPTEHVGEGDVFAAGVADVSTQVPVMQPPSIELELVGDNRWTPGAMDISGGSVIHATTWIIDGIPGVA